MFGIRRSDANCETRMKWPLLNFEIGQLSCHMHDQCKYSKGILEVIGMKDA